MSSKKDDVDIGFDPLAWMNDSDSSDTSEEVTTKSAAESASATTEEVVVQAETESAPRQQPVASGEKCRIDLAGKVDIAFMVPSERTTRIQETHSTLGHVICQMVDEILFEAPRKK